MGAMNWLVMICIGVWCVAGCAVLVQFGLWLKLRQRPPLGGPRHGERRGAARFSYAASVRLRLIEAGGTLAAARATNISNGGIYVIAPWALAAGTDIVCELPTSNGPLVRSGKVARVSPTSATDFGMGIAFEEVALIDEAGSRRPLTVDLGSMPVHAPTALA